MTNIKSLLLVGALALHPAAAWAWLGDGSAWTPPYLGPGDTTSNVATAWYGLRGYTWAISSPGTAKAVNVRRASDSTTKDIVVLSTGSLDVASAASFAGTDATATCSTSGSSTTLSCTSASSTPNTFDPISATGITQPAFIYSCGTFTGGAGSCTMNVVQNISARTVTFQVGLFVAKWYDQTQGNHCASASCDLVQATAGNQFQLLLTCLGTSKNLPCIMAPTASPSTVGLAAVGNFTPASGVVSFEGVVERTVADAGGNIVRQNGGNNRFNINSANLWSLTFPSVTLTATANDGALRLGVAVANGASTVIYIDGVSAATGTLSGNTTTGQLSTGYNGNISEAYRGEIGFWDGVALSSTVASAIHTNVSLYWGTP
jgi:hypothetical protein